jgi:phosphonopyruvate decarboxylase
MIDPEKLYNFLKGKGIDFYTGVPDSVLKDFLQFVYDHSSREQHIITANEGLAIGLAAGYYLRSQKIPVVYLQNSGLGNIINPLTSLVDKEMYGVPMLILMGWRGEPGTKDEPQHKKMGRITEGMLKTLELPVVKLSTDAPTALKNIGEAVDMAQDLNSPIVILVPAGTFNVYKKENATSNFELKKSDAIERLIGNMSGDEIVVCTTGKIGREFYDQNERLGFKIKKYFLSVGAMGHANHIAAGLKIGSDEKIIMLDGDGAVLMHLGSLTTIGHRIKNNFIHIVLNNGSHESVGGQPTEGFHADLCMIARGAGYIDTKRIEHRSELDNWLQNGFKDASLQFVEIRINNESSAEPGRPKGEPIEWKNEFIRALNKK